MIPAQIAASAMRRSQPLTAHLELTYACNWRCVFCYNPRHFDLRRLSAAEWTTVLDDLRALGTLSVTLTGGEPLAHPEALAIVRAARARAFVVRLFTNGSLVDDEVARELSELNVSVEASLHGATAETHDRATAKPGSFEALWVGIAALQRHGVPVFLKTPVTSWNESELDQMIELAARSGTGYRLDPNLTPRDDGDMSPLSYRASTDALRRVLLLGLETGTIGVLTRSEGDTNCSLGRTTIAIDPEGNVFPCMQWRRKPLGNVRDTALLKMWPDSPVRREASDLALKANERMMELGGALAEHSYCPALAAQVTGDPLRPDRNFIDRATLVSELRGDIEESNRK